MLPNPTPFIAISIAAAAAALIATINSFRRLSKGDQQLVSRDLDVAHGQSRPRSVYSGLIGAGAVLMAGVFVAISLSVGNSLLSKSVTGAARPNSEATHNSDSASPDVELAMPDLVGIQQGDAVEMLTAAGIEDYRIEERANPNTPGEVLAQLPSPGSPVRGPVNLIIAVPLPSMPDYVGHRASDARSELESWGVAVYEEYELNTDQRAGEVAGSIPAAGETIGREVVLRTTVAPVIGLPGDDVAVVSMGNKGRFAFPNDDSVEINGEIYEASLYVQGGSGVRPGDLGFWEYNLDRDWEVFESSVGLLGSAQGDQEGRFRIILDGSVIWEEDVRGGQTAEVSVNVSDGLRLRLEAVSLANGPIGLGWGGTRLVGIPGEAPGRNEPSHNG